MSSFAISAHKTGRDVFWLTVCGTGSNCQQVDLDCARFHFQTSLDLSVSSKEMLARPTSIKNFKASLSTSFFCIRSFVSSVRKTRFYLWSSKEMFVVLPFFSPLQPAPCGSFFPLPDVRRHPCSPLSPSLRKRKGLV